MRSQDLRVQKHDLVEQGHALLDRADQKKRALTQEEQNNYDMLWDKILKLDAEIHKAEQREYIQSTDPAPTPAAERRMAAFRKLLKSGNSSEYRDLAADAGVGGGYFTAPELFVDDLITAIDDETFIRQLATVNTVPNAAALGVPTLETDPADADWTTEVLVGNEETTMAFGKRELTPKPLAKFVKVSKKLLRLAPKAETEIIQRLAYKFAVTFEKACLSGPGITGPLGVFTASANGISTSRDVSTGNTATSIQTGGLKEAKYTLKAAYWKKANWIFHRDAVKQMAKLQDDNARYLWTDSLVVGEPDMLLGIPVRVSEYAPNTFTAGQYVGVLGNFKYYRIADVLGFQVVRLNELFAEKNETGFIGRMESDGMPTLEAAFVRVQLG